MDKHNEVIVVCGTECFILKGQYPNGRHAIVLHAIDGCPFATVSVNLPRAILAPDEIAIKTWGGNEIVVSPVLATGLFEDTGKRLPSGYVEAQVWRIKDSDLFDRLPVVG